MADQYAELLKDCILGVDCHDAGEDSVLIPHVRVHSDEEGQPSCSFSLAQLFGLRFILLREGDPGMMAVSFRKRYKMPLITIEIGGAKRVFPNFVNKALLGIQNVLIGNGMIEGELQIPKRQVLIKKRFGIRSKAPGILKFNSRLGSIISKGEFLGTIYYPQLQETAEIISPIAGNLFSRRYTQLVPSDGFIYSVLESDVYAGERESENVTALPNFEIKRLSV